MKKKVVLAGNPNVGKSVFFNYLTGVYVEVSNYPGTTVDITRGKLIDTISNQEYEIVDTPGVYGVSSFNDEEKVARDVIVTADIIINIVEALHLQRDLFLTQQMIDMGKPMIVCVNMMDEVERNGKKIDLEKLETLLGVPVIATVAIKNQGLEEVKNSLEKAKAGIKTDNVEKLITMSIPRDEKDIPPSAALLVAEEDPIYLEKYNAANTDSREKIYNLRRKHVDEIISRVITTSIKKADFATKLSKITLQPSTGIPIFLLVLAVIFYIIGYFISQIVVEFTEGVLLGTYYHDFIVNLLGGFLSTDNFFGALLIGEYGLLTMVPIYLFGLLLPLVAAFYLLMAIMEDTGYLPRVATLTDKTLTKLGLNGRAIIPIILGFGCVTAATISTRILGSKRERIIATALLGLTIPCSAQTGIIITQLAPLGIGYTVAYIAVIGGIFILIGAALNKLLPGKSTNLLIDVPRLRLPKAANIAKKTYSKTSNFIVEALPLFAIGSTIITVLEFSGALKWIIEKLSPFMTGFLGLPKETATVFVMGIIRRDFGAAGLSNMVDGGLMNMGQVFNSLVILTLFVPCIAAIVVMFKERSKLEAASIWIGSITLAFLVGGLINLTLSVLPI